MGLAFAQALARISEQAQRSAKETTASAKSPETKKAAEQDGAAGSAEPRPQQGLKPINSLGHSSSAASPQQSQLSGGGGEQLTWPQRLDDDINEALNMLRFEVCTLSQAVQRFEASVPETDDAQAGEGPSSGSLGVSEGVRAEEEPDSSSSRLTADVCLERHEVNQDLQGFGRMSTVPAESAGRSPSPIRGLIRAGPSNQLADLGDLALPELALGPLEDRGPADPTDVAEDLLLSDEADRETENCYSDI